MATSEENSVMNESIANSEEDSNRNAVENDFPAAQKRIMEEEEDYSLKKRRKLQPELADTIISKVKTENYATSSAPKKTLHGLTYQLRLLMLFLERVPDDQEFFLATEMNKAEQFDDIVLKYKENGAWRCKFLQAKHKNNTKYKIKKIDLFHKNLSSKINTKSDKPYFLKTYYDSFCKIKENNFFNDAYLDEFLVCTNIGFAEDALSYVKTTKETDDDPILRNWVPNEQESSQNAKPIKYKLKKRKFSELKQKLDVNKQDEDKLSQFIEVFRYLVNYEDIELNKNIRFYLKQYLRIENADLAYGYLQNRVLNWFESYQNNQSKYLLIKDKKRFLDGLNNNIQFLLVAGYSIFYIDELKKYNMAFYSTLSTHDLLKKGKDISIIVTLSTKLTIIKLGQLFNKLKFNQDEIIFVDVDTIQHNSKIINAFVSESSYQWLVIEYKKGLKVDRNLLINNIKRTKEKCVIIIGQEDDVLDFNKCRSLNTIYFYDKDISFKDLTIDSQVQLLKKEVTFQNNKVNLNQLIDIHLATEIVDASILESLLDRMEIGNNEALISDYLIEDYYIPRTLARKEIEPHIFQNEELLKNCLFFITNTNEDHLTKLNIKNEWIFSWEPNIAFNNGIVVTDKMTPKNIFLELCKNDINNVCWLELVDGRFFLKNIRNNNDILRKHNICFKENDLSNRKILEEKISIVVGDPGCGKSIFMTVVARQLKKIASDIWVLRINLSSYSYNKKKLRNKGDQNDIKSLEDITFRENDTNEAIIFLANILFSQANKSKNQYFVKELFIRSLCCDKKSYCKLPRIILIFDGFDEICPKFKEETLKLLKAIKLSNVVQMWITTRNHERLSLEQALGASALFLNPLHNVDKITFLNKFWLYSLYNFDDRKSEKYTENVISYFTEIRQNLQNDFDCVKIVFDSRNCSLNNIMNKLDFSDVARKNINYFEYFGNRKLSDFTDNILHLNMLAEIVFLNKFNNLGSKELPFLYQEFINNKFTVCCEDKNAAGNSLLGREIFEEHSENLKITYQELAFQILFPEHEQQFKQINNKVTLAKTGILVIYGDRLDFVHRSFAEYFVSGYFANNLQHEYIQDLVFSDILVNKKYELIRSFLNTSENFLEKLGNKNEGMINILSKNVFNLELLYQMVWEETFDLFVCYFKNLPSKLFEQDVLKNDKRNYVKDILVRAFIDIFPYNKQILKSLDTVKSSAPPKIFDDKILKSILNVIKRSVSPKTLDELLFSTAHNREQTVLHSAIVHRSSVAKTIIEFVKENCNPNIFYQLLLQENNKKMTVLHFACMKSSNITDESEYEDTLIYLLKLSKDSEITLNEFILKNDCHGNVALYYTVLNFDSFSMFKVFLDFIKIYCTNETLNTVLLKTDNDERTILHIICIEKCEEYLSNFLNAIKDESDILSELLLKQDFNGETALHYTIRNYDSPVMLETLVKFITINCSSETLNILLLKENNFECTALHNACINIENKKGYEEILTSFLNLVKSNKEVLNELILKTNRSGATALHFILDQFETPSMLQIILEFVSLNCDLEIFNKLLLKVDNEGRNTLHFACEQELEDNLNYLLSIAKPEIIKDILVKPDNEGLNPLHYCILLFDNPVMLKHLVDFIKMNFDLYILTSPLYTVTNKEQTVLHIACSKNEEYKMEYVEILTYLLNKIDNTKLNEMLLKIDYEGRTILHYILSNFDSLSMLETVFDFIKINCSNEIFEKFLFFTDLNGQTCLHILCKSDTNVEILTYLLNVIEEHSDQISLKEFLFKKDSCEKTALDYILCKSSCSSMLNVLTNFIQQHSS